MSGNEFSVHSKPLRKEGPQNCRKIIQELVRRKPKGKCMWVVVKIKVPFWGTLNNMCRIIIGTQKGTLILTTTHLEMVSQHQNMLASRVSQEAFNRL